MAKRRSGKGFAEQGIGYRTVPRPLAEPMALPDGTVRYVLKLGPKGRVLLPASVRAAMGLVEGDTVLGWLKDGKLTLQSQRAALKTIQDQNRRRAGGRSVVDELLAERRAAAARGE